jgi:rRNA maturation endonuclease Nob1
VHPGADPDNVTALTGHAASLAAFIAAVGIVMTRLGLSEGRLRSRWERRCVSCGTIVQTRVCPRCGAEQR